KGLELQPLSALANAHFNAPADARRFDNLVQDCEIFGIGAEPRAFAPAYVPALLVRSADAASQREQLIEALRTARIDGSLARRVEKALATDINPGMSFFLNTSNKLITDLADHPDQVARRAAVLALYNIAFMNTFPDTKPSELKTIHESIER